MNKGLLGLIITIILITVLIIINNKKPKNLELTYKINAGIPFKWEYSIEDETVVKLKKSYITKNDNKGAKVGAPIYTKYIFQYIFLQYVYVYIYIFSLSIFFLQIFFILLL